MLHNTSPKTQIDKSMVVSATEDEKVVITQTLCRVEPVFVYRVPPMKTSGGHRAEDWNLASPAATCSMHVLQQDNALLIQLMGIRPGTTEEFLFAQAKIVFDLALLEEKSHKPIEYWVEAVVDSSRYFVIRCEDERTNRQAFVGVGFRERDESMNFKMSLEDFWRSMEREKKALQMQQTYDNETTDQQADDITSPETLDPLISRLSLKEGEKIHINLKGGKGQKTRERRSSDGVTESGKPLLLRKPPPPGGVVVAVEDQQDAACHVPEIRTSYTEDDTCAKIDQSTNVENDDDEDWGDFKG